MTEEPAIDVVTRDDSLPSGVFKAVLSVGPDLRESETRVGVGKVAYNLDLWEVRLRDRHVIRRINVFLSAA